MGEKLNLKGSIWEEKWKEEPYSEKPFLGLSIWTWITILYYIWAVIFTIIIAGLEYPTATKILQLIIVYGVGLNGVYAAYFSEKFIRGGGRE